MSGYPSAADLVEAVREYLAGVESQLPGRDGFHAKVAGNVLATVARELRQQPEQVEQAALAALLGRAAPLAELRRDACAALRDGRLGIDTPGLLDRLTEATLARLAVDNPNFSTFRRLTEKAT
jgi:hypothetical protein